MKSEIQLSKHNADKVLMIIFVSKSDVHLSSVCLMAILHNDVLRLIVETLALQSREYACSLLTVSRSFKEWVQPILYGRVSLRSESQIGSFILAMKASVPDKAVNYTTNLWVLCTVPPRLNDIFGAPSYCRNLARPVFQQKLYLCIAGAHVSAPSSSISLSACPSTVHRLLLLKCVIRSAA